MGAELRPDEIAARSQSMNIPALHNPSASTCARLRASSSASMACARWLALDVSKPNDHRVHRERAEKFDVLLDVQRAIR